MYVHTCMYMYIHLCTTYRVKAWDDAARRGGPGGAHSGDAGTEGRGGHVAKGGDMSWENLGKSIENGSCTSEIWN